MQPKRLERQTAYLFKKHRAATSFFTLALGVFLASMLITAVFEHVLAAEYGIENLYTHQADAFLQGRLNVPEKVHDVAIYKGQYFVTFPPFPAVLLMPFEALFAQVSVTLIATILTLISGLVLSAILETLKLERALRLWLLLAFFLGTGYWNSAIESYDVWSYAHIVSVTFMLLAIKEALKSGHGLVAGLFLGSAFLSRQLSIYSAIFIFAVLLVNANNASRASKVRSTLGFGVALGACIGVYLLFNYARFGDPFDTGYAYLELGSYLGPRLEQYGLFNLAYVPFNLIYMFFQGPHIEFGGSVAPQGVDLAGTSITFASPFLYLAFLAKGNRWIRIGAWLTIGFALTHMMLYYNNGWQQVNAQRFTLDFLPVLIVLVALAAKSIDKRRPLLYWSIVYSVLLNAVMLLFALVLRLLN